jgi:hypothetical protein
VLCAGQKRDYSLLKGQLRITKSMRTKTGQKLVQTQFFMKLSTGIPVLRKFWFKTLQKIPFREGHVQDSSAALPGHGSKISAAILEDILLATGKFCL